jgi:transketolase
MVRRGKAESYHKDAWKKDTLLLTCILRLRVQPAVSYRDISDILLKALSKHLSGVAENSANLAKLKSTTTNNNTSFYSGQQRERRKGSADEGVVGSIL